MCGVCIQAGEALRVSGTNHNSVTLDKIIVEVPGGTYSLLELHGKAVGKLKRDHKDFQETGALPSVYIHASEKEEYLTFYYFCGFGQKTWSVKFNRRGEITSVVGAIAVEKATDGLQNK
jgi:hypothetical protein